jgi:hypothetical protein
VVPLTAPFIGTIRRGTQARRSRSQFGA